MRYCPFIPPRVLVVSSEGWEREKKFCDARQGVKLWVCCVYVFDPLGALRALVVGLARDVLNKFHRASGA